MKRFWFSTLLLVLFLVVAPVHPVFADGIVIPEPIPCDGDFCPPPMQQLTIRYHHVDVEIDNQVAVTHIDQVFYNPNSWVVEGTYVFPLPVDAVVENFVLWVDGKPVEGRVMSADEARQTYEEIVRNMQDPALLEYIGQGAVQASIFPIQPGEERRIELQYSQALTAENGLVKYTYPLNTEKFSARLLESVVVRVEVHTSQPLRAIYSPSHPIATQQEERSAVVTYEASQVRPDQDFSLVYSIGESEAFHLFSYRDPGSLDDPEGFFMLLLAPRPNTPKTLVSKDVLLVLDRSGSMEGEKFKQAQAALKYILAHLNPDDRFAITTFSSGVEMYSSRLKPASEAMEASRWVDQLAPEGSTDINRALLETLSIADRERPTYLIFLTDGLPTEGIVDSQQIVDNFAAAAPSNIRMFPFGVGYDVDTFLLDSLSQTLQGQSTYVQPGQALDESLLAFYSKISTPVLTNLSLDFGDMAVYDVYPQPLPDLFSGSQIVVTGRYREGGVTNIILSGEVNGQPQTIKFKEVRFERDSRNHKDPDDSLPRLWATRKIGHLLNSLRLNGANQETIDQIVALSIRYGIVTPYTSYLVTEPMPLGAANQDRVAEEAYSQILSTPTVVYGEDAVQKAAEQGAMSESEQAYAPSGEVQETVRVVGSRTFVLSAGVWIDTAFDPDTMKTVRIEFLSDDYFTLAQYRPDVSAALALGQRVILLVDGKPIEIVPAGETADPLDLPEPADGDGDEDSTEEHSAPVSEPASSGENDVEDEIIQPVEEEKITPICASGLLLPLGLGWMWMIWRSRN